jgi:flagellar protein FliO/FliZ
MATVMMLGRLLLSLAAVLLLMWFVARRLRGSTRRGNAEVLDVLGRRQLSRTSSVAVVRVLDQALIIGITDTHVSLLGETDLDAAREAAHAAADTEPERSPQRRPRPATRPARLAGSALSPATWRQTLESLRELTVRNR